MLLNQVAQALWDPSHRRLQALRHLPAPCNLPQDALPHQLVHDHHQEQGIAIGALAQDASECIWQGSLSKALSQIGCHPPLRQIGQRKLYTPPVPLQLLHHRTHRMRPHNGVHWPICPQDQQARPVEPPCHIRQPL